MKILKNYIFKEWFLLFALSIVIISFILVVGNIVKLVELVIAKGVNAGEILKLFGYLLPSLLIFSIPIAILTATLLGFGRMASDNEITAIRSAGISFYPIIADLLLVGLMFSLLCLYFNDSLIPQSHYRTRNILREIGVKKPTAYLEEKTFIKAFKGYIIFIYKIKGDQLEDVRIYQPQPDKPTRTIIAREGEFIPIPEKDAIKLLLRKGSVSEPTFAGNKMFYKMNFNKTYKILLELQDKQDIEKLGKKASDMTIRELNEEIKNLRNLGVDVQPLLVGLYRKFSLSFSSLVFILIGVPLAIKAKRRERSLGFGLSLIVCLFYYLLMALGESLALRNMVNPVLGVWLPNIVVLIIGGFLTFKVLED